MSENNIRQLLEQLASGADHLEQELDALPEERVRKDLLNDLQRLADRVDSLCRRVEAPSSKPSFATSFFRQIVSQNHLPIAALNPQMEIVYRNEAFDTIFRNPGSVSQTLHLSSILDEDSFQRIDAISTESIANGAQRIVVNLHLGNQTWRSTELILSTLRPTDGETITVMMLHELGHNDEEKQRVLASLEMARIGTWDLNLKTNQLYWSDQVRAIHEVPADYEPDVETAINFYKQGKHRTRIREAVEKAIEDCNSYELDLLIVTAKGNERWIRTVADVEMANGECIRLFGTTQDIDHQKRAQVESEKYRLLLEAIINRTQTPIWIRRLDGTLLLANQEWMKTFGVDATNALGKQISTIFPPDVSERISERDRMVHSSGKAHSFEEMVELESGNKVFIANIFPLKGVPGFEDAIGGVATDVTELKEAQNKLLDTEQKLRDIIEHSTNLFYRHDTDHNLTYVSPQSLEFFGYEPKEAMRKWTNFITDHPLNEAGMRNTLLAIETGKPQPPYHLELQHRNGFKLWVEVNEAPVVRDGKTVMIVGSLTNITERKRAQLAIRESLKEKVTLLAEIHHRVKNNLAVVAGMMQMQAMTSDNDMLSDLLLQSVLRIKSMANIHESLYQSQNFSKIDFGENLLELTQSIINTMQFETDLNLTSDLEPVTLNVNQAIPCSLILNEVITNCIKHAFPGRKSGRIHLRLTEKNNLVTITITDNGVGFDVDNTKPGKSLGIKLIDTLAEQLGGHTAYTSDSSATSFTLTFTKESPTEKDLPQ
ncbi:MAG: PAS domain S-box protein [Balneolaceae bacterium]